MKETLYYNGTILTMDEKNPKTQAVLVKNGTIKAVGTYEELKGHGEEVDLHGKTMLPGFIDGHSHIGMACLFPMFYPSPAGNINSVEDLIQQAKKEIADHPVKKGKWFVGMGYDNARFPDKKHPTSKQLDEISTEIPIAMMHVSGHVGVLNTKGMEICEITRDTKDPAGGRINKDPQTGEPTGLLEENALTDALAQHKANVPSIEVLCAGIEKAQKMYASFGITTVQEGMTSKGLPAIFKMMAAAGKLKLDIVSYPPIDGNVGALRRVDSMKVRYKNHFRIAGAKIIGDGSPQAKTAWLTKPFYVEPEGESPDYRGYPRYQDAKMEKMLNLALEHNWQVLCHCNGDATGDQFIKYYKNAMKKTVNQNDLRPVMIHAQTVREDQLDEMKEIGMMPSFFHDHIFYWGDYHMSSVLGPDRGRRISPLKSALDRGIPFTIHDDAPVVTPNVIFALHNAVNRITRDGQPIGPEFAVSIEDALKSVTVWGAYQYHEESIKGSITPGKYADFVILDQNPLEVEKSKIKEIKVLETIKEDQIVFKKED